jgi:hypothetical protein
VPTAADEDYQWRTTESGNRIRLIYYQITYRKLSKGTAVRVFRTDPDREEESALDRLSTRWHRAGESPWGRIERIRAKAASAKILPGETQELLRLAGPGVVYELKIEIDPADPVLWNDSGLTDALVLEATWDGALHPQVCVPLAALFAAPDPRRDVLGVWSGCLGKQYYTYLPMPFARSAVLRLSNRSRQLVTVGVHCNWRKGPSKGLSMVSGQFRNVTSRAT